MRDLLLGLGGLIWDERIDRRSGRPDMRLDGKLTADLGPEMTDSGSNARFEV